MPEKPKCPRCHTEVRLSDYFCYNCGVNLKPKPPATDLTAMLVLFFKSFIVPPFGFLWAYPYLKQKDPKSKMMGYIAILITVVTFVLGIIWFDNFIKSINSLLQNQVDNSGYF